MRPIAASGTCAAAVPAPSPASLALSRLADYTGLFKPRILVLILLAVSAGYTLGCADRWDFSPLWHTLAGVALVAAGSSALNQFVERRTDARMHRTAQRPLPAGRLNPWEVFSLGLAAALGGVAYLAVCVNSATAILAAATFVLYALVYTFLKRWTSLCTAVGAIPGAMPPVLGWTAGGGSLDGGAFSLFALLFLWQFPHFLAIAWIYKDDYARAGLKMLPFRGEAPGVTGILTVGYCLVLIPLSLYPKACGLAGVGYVAAALILGAVYLLAAVRFAARESAASARQLLAASLVYLPVLLSALVWDHWRLLS